MPAVEVDPVDARVGLDVVPAVELDLVDARVGSDAVPAAALDLVDARVDCLVERRAGPCAPPRPRLEDFTLGIVDWDDR